MKILYITMLSLIFLTSNAQINWEELEHHNNSKISLSYITKEGVFIGLNKYPHQLLYSEDNGISWELLYEGEELLSKYNSYPQNFTRHAFEQDSEGNLFIFVNDDIYKYSWENKDLTSIIHTDDIEDFCFLPNGNIAVSQSRYLKLFSPEGSLIKEVEWWTHTSQLLPGEGDTHYVTHSHGASKSIVEFNSSLTLVSKERPIPSSYHGYYYNDSRLFAGENYSDDGGVSWHKKGTTDYLQEYAVSNNRVVLLYHSYYIISYDNGNSYETKDFDSEISGRNCFLYEDTEIVISNDHCGQEEIYHSNDNGNNWSISNVEHGLPFAYRVEAGYDGNIFINSCGGSYFKQGDQHDWEVPTNNNGGYQCYSLGDVICLPNGSVITNSGCISSDQGATWSSYYYLHPFFENNLVLKNDALYSVDYLERLTSYDYGITWQKSSIKDSTFFFLDVFVYMANGEIIISDWDQQFYKIDLAGNITLFNIDGPFIDIASSYRGNNLYLLKQDWDTKIYEFEYSTDGGDQYNSIILDGLTGSNFRFYTDQFGNIFIYNKKTIWLSIDEGQTWEDISPIHDDLIQINDIDVGYDGHVYIATHGTGILKSDIVLNKPKKLKVIVFNDENDDCEFSSNEQGIQRIKVKVNGQLIKQTDNEGQVTFQMSRNNNSLEILINENLYQVCNFDSDVIFQNGILTQELYIPISIIKDCIDLSVNATTPRLRRCFDNQYTIQLENNGTLMAEQVQIVVVLDDFYEFHSCDLPIISTNGQEIILDAGNIPTNEIIRTTIDFNLSCDAELGLAHYINVEVNFDNSCTKTSIAEAFECQMNIGSFDPNDKRVFVNGIADKEIIKEEDKVEYLIRFQNTGTDTAFTVKIIDPLAYYYDLDDIEIVASSHDYTWNINRRKLEVVFDNILLPDSTINEKASHGFIKFKLKLKKGFESGSRIVNGAQIYFDYNDPIHTNKTINFYNCKNLYKVIRDTICEGDTIAGYTITGFYTDYLISPDGCDSTRHLDLLVLGSDDPRCLNLSLSDISNQEKTILYPNPARDKVFFDIPKGKQVEKIEIINAIGKIVQYETLEHKQEINTSELSTGVYFINLHMLNGIIDSHKILILKE